MTDQISTLIPSLCLVGEYIQTHVQQGYRLVEGYPLSYGWQYEVIMEKAPTIMEKPLAEAVAEAPKKPGRPKQ